MSKPLEFGLGTISFWPVLLLIKRCNHPGSSRNLPGEQSFAIHFGAEVDHGDSIADGIALSLAGKASTAISL